MIGIAEITDSEGFKINQKISSLKTSEYILDRNYINLIQLIDIYKKDSSIWNIDQRDRLFDFQKEFTRVFHNYLAGAKSLLDHTRTLKNKLNNANLNRQYDAKRLEKLDHNYVFFIQKLRQFAQHYANLPIACQVNVIDRNTAERLIVLYIKDLNEFDGWDQPSKNFFKETVEYIDIENVVSKYQKSIKDFYTWLHETIRNEYKSELEDFENKYKQYEEMQKKFLEQIRAGKTSGSLL